MTYDTLPTLATTVPEASITEMTKYASRDLCGFAILTWPPANAPEVSTDERS
jgi:hypothetical protein